MQKYDFTAPSSGGSQVINAPGRYMKYVTGNAGGNDAGLIVTPGGKPGTQILMYPGQAITLPDDGGVPNAWTVRNAVGAANISGSVIIGNGKIDDDTLSGTVQVVDGGKVRTLSGSACIGYGAAGPVAAQFSRIELWNPATSATRLVVEAVTLVGGGQAAEGCYFYFTQTQLATLSGNGMSKRSSIATAAQGQIRTDTTAAGIPGNGLLTALIQTNQSFQNKFNEPLVIDPGYGLMGWSTAANDAMGVGFEWYEEPNV